MQLRVYGKHPIENGYSQIRDNEKELRSEWVSEMMK